MASSNPCSKDSKNHNDLSSIDQQYETLDQSKVQSQEFIKRLEKRLNKRHAKCQSKASQLPKNQKYSNLIKPISLKQIKTPKINYLILLLIVLFVLTATFIFFILENNMVISQKLVLLNQNKKIQSQDLKQSNRKNLQNYEKINRLQQQYKINTLQNKIKIEKLYAEIKLQKGQDQIYSQKIKNQLKKQQELLIKVQNQQQINKKELEQKLYAYKSIANSLKQKIKQVFQQNKAKQQNVNFLSIQLKKQKSRSANNYKLYSQLEQKYNKNQQNIIQLQNQVKKYQQLISSNKKQFQQKIQLQNQKNSIIDQQSLYFYEKSKQNQEFLTKTYELQDNAKGLQQQRQKNFNLNTQLKSQIIQLKLKKYKLQNQLKKEKQQTIQITKKLEQNEQQNQFKASAEKLKFNTLEYKMVLIQQQFKRLLQKNKNLQEKNKCFQEKNKNLEEYNAKLEKNYKDLQQKSINVKSQIQQLKLQLQKSQAQEDQLNTQKIKIQEILQKLEEEIKQNKNPQVINDQQQKKHLKNNEILQKSQQIQIQSQNSLQAQHENQRIMSIQENKNEIFIKSQMQQQENEKNNYLRIQFQNEIKKKRFQQDTDKSNQLTQKSIYLQSNSMQNQNFRIRSQEKGTVSKQEEDKNQYDLKVSIKKMISESEINKAFSQGKTRWNGINRIQYERAIRLLQVVHNINFEGEFVFDHFKFYSSPEEKYSALQKILTEEKTFLEEKYQISKYIHNQIRFCVCVPSYNNARSRLYLRNLDSIFQQQYKNYYIVYINDASEDDTGVLVQNYMEKNNIPSYKYIIINNKQRQGTSKNLYEAAHNYCQEGQIMTMVDGDDSLIGRQTFSLFNAVYQKQKIALAYTQYFELYTTKIVSGYSEEIPQTYLENGTYRKIGQLYGIHTNSMYVDIFRKVKVSDFQYTNGTFFQYNSDTAYFTPCVQLAGTRVKYIPVITYEHRKDYSQYHAPQWRRTEVKNDIYSRQPYTKLQQMPFADNPKTSYYP